MCLCVKHISQVGMDIRVELQPLDDNVAASVTAMYDDPEVTLSATVTALDISVSRLSLLVGWLVVFLVRRSSDAS